MDEKKPTAREIRRAALSAVILLVLVCAFGEIGARVLDLNPASLITLDNCTGYKLIPNATGVVGGPNGHIPVHANSIGFRDTEHSFEKPAGVYRVLFLGDSFTEALQVPFEDIFWRQLQKKADAAHMKLEVIGMGVSSWGTGQELLAYECYGRQFHPDLVVLAFNADDLLDNYFRVDPFTPTFSDMGDTLTLDETYKTNITRRLVERKTLYPGLLYFIKDNSMLARSLLLKLENARAGAALGRAAGNESPATPMYAESYSPPWVAAWKLTGDILSKLTHEVRGDNAKLVLVYFPPLAQLEPSQTILGAGYDLTKPNAQFTALGTRLGVPVIDLYPVIAASSTIPIHWNHDPHLTSYGHTLVANVLFDTLQLPRAH